MFFWLITAFEVSLALGQGNFVLPYPLLGDSQVLLTHAVINPCTNEANKRHCRGVGVCMHTHVCLHTPVQTTLAFLPQGSGSGAGGSSAPCTSARLQAATTTAPTAAA